MRVLDMPAAYGVLFLSLHSWWGRAALVERLLPFAMVCVIVGVEFADEGLLWICRMPEGGECRQALLRMGVRVRECCCVLQNMDKHNKNVDTYIFRGLI